MTTEYEWGSISFSIDGQPVPMDSVSLERREPDYGFDTSFLRPKTYEVSCTATIPIENVDAFASLFRREPPGASALTLARRVRYGGRKGRAAMRRLLARALPVELSNDYCFMRGRCVMLDETEMVVKMGGRSGRRPR